MGKRVRVTPTDDWRQVELLTRSPEQRAYELIRPVVLFDRSPAERAQETGAAERTLYRHITVPIDTVGGLGEGWHDPGHAEQESRE